MSNASNIAKGGLYTALSLLCIYLSSIMPTSQLYILGIACCIMPLAILTTNIKNSLIIYVATSLLSLLLLGFKWNVFAYIIFFGNYGFIKYFIERLNKLPIEIILKLIYFSVCMIAIYFIYKILLVNVLNFKLPIAVMILAFEVMFLFCDYALTVFISFANRRFIRRMK